MAQKVKRLTFCFVSVSISEKPAQVLDNNSDGSEQNDEKLGAPYVTLLMLPLCGPMVVIATLADEDHPVSNVINL